MKIRKWVRIAATGLLICLFWWLLASLGAGGSLNFAETPLRDLMRAKSDAERAPLAQVKIIKIDDYSLAQLGQFPWDRSLYAELIRMLADAGAQAVFLDIVLAEPGAYPEGDEAMAEVMRDYPDVILPTVFNFRSIQEEAGMLETESITYPTPTVGASREQTAHINVMQDRDGTVRMLSIGFPEDDGTMMPAVSVKLANYLLDEDTQIRYDADTGTWRRGNDVIPVNSRNQVTIDYFTNPREQMNANTGYDTRSFVDVLTGEIPADFYYGDVVLIGPWASGLQDEYLTPLSRTTKMYGVEIHANMVQSLVTGAFYFEVPPAVNYALILLMVLLGLVLFERFPGRPSIWIYLGLTAAYILLWLSVYYFYSYFISFVYPFLALTTALVAAIVAHYAAERRERGRVTTIFGRFVSKDVVDAMLSSGDEVKVGGQRRDITVIFVDIRGFTPMSERLQPEQVIEVLNEYLDLCTQAVFEYKGTLDKFIGDGVMAFFGAPVELPDHPAQAIRAALRMKAQSDVLEQQCVEKYGIGVKFGVGLNCGPAVVGNIGSELLRLDYTAIGDTVNLAARLESNAKPGQILISEGLFERVGHLFETEDCGEIKVKGKEKPVRVYSVLAERIQPQGATNVKEENAE